MLLKFEKYCLFSACILPLWFKSRLLFPCKSFFHVLTFVSIFPTPYNSRHKTIPVLVFLASTSSHLLSHRAISFFVFSLSSSSMAELMHSHRPFIHGDVLFIKASIIQPTPGHLRLLRPISHSITPPPPTHGVSLEANALPVTLLFFPFFLSCLHRFHYFQLPFFNPRRSLQSICSLI